CGWYTSKRRSEGAPTHPRVLQAPGTSGMRGLVFVGLTSCFTSWGLCKNVSNRPPKDRFNLGPGQVPAPDPQLPAVGPDQKQGERCKEICHLGFGEVVGDDPTPPAEGLLLDLCPFSSTH